MSVEYIKRVILAEKELDSGNKINEDTNKNKKEIPGQKRLESIIGQEKVHIKAPMILPKGINFVYFSEGFYLHVLNIFKKEVLIESYSGAQDSNGIWLKKDIIRSYPSPTLKNFSVFLGAYPVIVFGGNIIILEGIQKLVSSNRIISTAGFIDNKIFSYNSKAIVLDNYEKNDIPSNAIKYDVIHKNNEIVMIGKRGLLEVFENKNLINEISFKRVPNFSSSENFLAVYEKGEIRIFKLENGMLNIIYNFPVKGFTGLSILKFENPIILLTYGSEGNIYLTWMIDTREYTIISQPEKIGKGILPFLVK